MFRFSTRILYGLRGVLLLAKIYPRTISVHKIAEREQIPRTYLEQLLLEMKKRGVLRSKTGPGGGFGLSKKPGKITILEVFNALEGPIALSSCLLESYKPDCDLVETCITRLFYQKIKNNFEDILREWTLKDLIVEARISGIKPAKIKDRKDKSSRNLCR